MVRCAKENAVIPFRKSTLIAESQKLLSRCALWNARCVMNEVLWDFAPNAKCSYARFAERFVSNAANWRVKITCSAPRPAPFADPAS